MRHFIIEIGPERFDIETLASAEILVRASLEGDELCAFIRRKFGSEIDAAIEQVSRGEHDI
jgi:hypothetical protein